MRDPVLQPKGGTGEMDQPVRGLAALAEDPGSGPSTCGAAYNHPYLGFRGPNPLFWPPGHQALHTGHLHTFGQNTRAHEIKAETGEPC